MTALTIPKAPVLGVDDARSSFQQRGVRYPLTRFVDLHGVCKTKAVPIDHLNGVPQDESDNEVAAIPDLAAAAPLSSQVFGEAMADAFINFKREEWATNHSAISTGERERLLEPF
jgi:glutamine synthetase